MINCILNEADMAKFYNIFLNDYTEGQNWRENHSVELSEIKNQENYESLYKFLDIEVLSKAQRLTYFLEHDIWMVKMAIRLETNSTPDLEKLIFDLIDEKDAKFFILNFRETDYIGSPGLRLVLKTVKKTKGKGGNTILCGLKDYCFEVFNISGFDTFLPITNSLGEAINSIITYKSEYPTIP